MSTMRIWLAVAVIILGSTGPSAAAISSTQPTGLLVFPLISINATDGIDTVIQLTNAADPALPVRCTFENRVGTPTATPFAIQLTRNQPIAWRASAGLATLPGTATGTIPALGDGPFTGVLRCVTTTEGGMPTNVNALVGSATIERFDSGPPVVVDSAHYNATGFDALAAAANGDDQLTLGGSGAEYTACPEELALEIFFDGALLPLGADGAVEQELSTTLALVTCAHTTASNAGTVVTLRVINEMGQITSTSRSVQEQLVVPLSQIDTSNPQQSIFHFATQGTLTGLIRITPAASASGVLAVAIQSHTDPDDEANVHTAAVRPQLLGERETADVIDLGASTVPTSTATVMAATPTPTSAPASCVGDCDADDAVEINELIRGVNIALGNQPLPACTAFDRDDNGDVSIGELIAAVNNSLEGCE